VAKGDKQKPSAPDVCPVCGDEVPPNASACPQCGADHNSGWKENTYDGLELPDDDFDYDEFIKQEFGSSVRPAGIKPLWWITALLLIILFAAIYFYAAR